MRPYRRLRVRRRRWIVLRAARSIAVGGARIEGDVRGRAPAYGGKVRCDVFVEGKIAGRTRCIEGDRAGTASLGELAVVRIADAARDIQQIGRASCRERGCQYV